MLTYIVLCALTILVVLYVFDTFSLKEVEHKLVVSDVETNKNGYLLRFKFKPSDPEASMRIVYDIGSDEYHEKVKQVGESIYLNAFMTYNRLRKWKCRVVRVESI